MINYSLTIGTGLKQDRAGAVSEDDAYRTIGIIRHRRIDIRTDHQNFLVLPRLHELHARIERIDKSGTSRRHIKAPGLYDPELVLHQARGRRIHHVGCDRTHYYEINLLQIEGMRFQQILHRRDCQITRSDTLLYNMSLPDSNSFENPFIRGIDHFFQISIRENARRDIRPERGDLGARGYRQ